LQPGKSVLCSRLTSCIYLLLLLLLLLLRVQQVVKEVLRYRPPAPMVPQVAMKPFNLMPIYKAYWIHADCPLLLLLLLLLSTSCAQVVKEVLRYRPPAPMVPQVAMKPFNLTASYKAPKGAFIIPDIISACRQGYTDPNKFDPDRFR
jgi:cytochrome P450